MKVLNMIALTLLIVGGLNWGLVGLFDFDAVAAIFGGPEMILSRIVYTLVGLSAVYSIFLLKPFTTIHTHHHGSVTAR